MSPSSSMKAHQQTREQLLSPNNMEILRNLIALQDKQTLKSYFVYHIL